MSHNYQLLDKRTTGADANAPRCTAEIARLYRSKEGAPAPLRIASGGPDDRRSAIGGIVAELFGRKGTKTPAALGCETYLLAALCRWLEATCRSEDSWTAYAVRLHGWVAYSGRRSLSAQLAAPPRQVADWLYVMEREGRAPRTIVARRESLASWFRWLCDRDLMGRSPVTRDIRRLHRIDRGGIVKASGRRQALTLAEAQRVAAWALEPSTMPEAGLSVLLQLTAGLRSQEVADLERRHLVEREGLVTLTVPGKGQRTRAVRLEPIAITAWRRYVAARRRQGERGPLLVAPGGGHYGRRAIQRWAKAAAKVVGREIEISSHDLRKTYATQLLLRGAAIEQVQEMLGHASADTTLTCYVTDRRPLSVTTGIDIPEAKP